MKLTETVAWTGFVVVVAGVVVAGFVGHADVVAAAIVAFLFGMVAGLALVAHEMRR